LKIKDFFRKPLFIN